MYTYWEDVIGQGVLLYKLVIGLFKGTEGASNKLESRTKHSEHTNHLLGALVLRHCEQRSGATMRRLAL